jgi:integrase
VLNSTLEKHLLPAFGNEPVNLITKADILVFRAALAEQPGRTRETLSAKRITDILHPLRQILADASDRYAFVSPMLNVRPLKVRKTDIEPFTLDQVQQLLAVVRADCRDYFTVRFFTGMHTGQCHGLKWKYVDFDARLILIRETFVLGEDEYTKTDSSQRDIQMTQVVYEALRRRHAAIGRLSAKARGVVHQTGALHRGGRRGQVLPGGGRDRALIRPIPIPSGMTLCVLSAGDGRAGAPTLRRCARR